MMLIFFSTPSGHAQQTLTNQAQVDQALKDAAEAEQQARDNTPGNPRVKDAEDALDAAIRKNEDTPGEPVGEKRKTQKAQDDAQTRADDVRERMKDRTTPDARERAKNYRDALQKRREARKKLREEYAAIRREAGNAQNQGLLDVLGFLRGWLAKVNAAVKQSERVITPQTQTAARTAPTAGRTAGQGVSAQDEQNVSRLFLGTSSQLERDNLFDFWFGVSATFRDANTGVSRLGSGAGPATSNPVSTVKQNDVGASGEIGLRFPIGAPSVRPEANGPLSRRWPSLYPSTGTPSANQSRPYTGSYVDISYAFTDVGGSSSGAGAQVPILNLAGLGVLGTNPGSVPGGYFCFNQPHTYFYDYSMARHLFQISTAFMSYSVTRDISVRPVAGARVAHTRVSDTFGVNVPVPGDPVTGRYTTTTDVISGGLFGGFDMIWSPYSPLTSFRFAFLLSARGGFDVNRATSEVGFSMNTNAFSDFQRVSITARPTTPYASLQGGVQAEYLGWMFGMVLFAEAGGFAPNVQIPGGGPRPLIDAAKEFSYGGKLAGRLSF